MALNTKKVKDVLSLLLKISGKWNFIGIALGIDIEDLKKNMMIPTNAWLT